MTNAFERIEASVVDGSAQTPRFRQKQLMKLHDALNKSRVDLVDALRKDCSHTSTEANIQFHLTLAAVKQLHDSMKVKDMLKEEYSMAHSQDNASRRIACGCVLVIAPDLPKLYDTIVPVAAAICAGNCVMLKIQPSLLDIGKSIRDLLVAVLDTDTFAVVDSKPGPEFLAHRTQRLIILDTNPKNESREANHHLQTPEGRSVAIVDRSGDIEEAARSVVRARFSFNGRCNYAPDVVLVNEYCLKKFCDAVGRYALSYMANTVDDAAAAPGKRIHTELDSSSPLQKDLDSASTTVLLAGSKGTIAIVHDRKSHLLRIKVARSVLLIHVITSMDDAIDLVNSGQTPLIAHYPFATPAAAKYLSQFVDSRLTCANHIPIELMAGPPGPVGFAASIQPRYLPEMFSRPTPEYINVSMTSLKLADVLDKADGSVATLTTTLAPSDEPKAGAIGFFEQGLMTSGASVLSLMVGSAFLTWRFIVPVIATRVGRR